MEIENKTLSDNIVEFEDTMREFILKLKEIVPCKSWQKIKELVGEELIDGK